MLNLFVWLLMENMLDEHLFPSIEPFQTGRFDVGDGHRLYYEWCGNPTGEPIVVLHGGPGSGCSPVMRQFFDPKRFRVLLFDQRGAGKSTPANSLEANTTRHLIRDIEALRTHFSIERWGVFGGSWGSTLALAYAEAHPEVVAGLVLRGIYLGSRSELESFFHTETPKHFPKAYERFTSLLDADERRDPLSAYHKRLNSRDKSVALEAAHHFAKYELQCLKIGNDVGWDDIRISDSFALAIARIEAHYMTNGCFLGPDGALLDGADKLSSIPTHILHGRRDGICPVKNAIRLADHMPHAQFKILENAGHSAFDPPLAQSLVEAANALPTIG